MVGRSKIYDILILRAREETQQEGIGWCLTRFVIIAPTHALVGNS
jgi:hypothetical protein